MTGAAFRFFLILAAGLWLGAAVAAVPEETIRQIAELNVQLAENRYLTRTRQIPGDHGTARKRELEDALDEAWRPLKALPKAEQQEARSRINGLVEARLALLEPQWQQRKAVLQEEAAAKARAIRDGIEADARAALEHQRRRLQLQQQKDGGSISPEAFAEGDQAALGAIQALRDKYLAEGDHYAREFDHRLALLTQALANNPDTPLPVSAVPAGQGGGTSPADYETDVALAADLLVKREEAAWKHSTGKMDSPTFRETDGILGRDLARLAGKWQADRGDAFCQDYTRRAQERLSAIRAEYQPAAVRNPSQGLPAAPERLSPEPSPSWGGWALLFGLAVIGGGVLVLFFRRLAPADPAPPLTTNFGTASFAGIRRDVAHEFLTMRGVFLGKSSSPETRGTGLAAPHAPVCSTPEHHTLIVARTRTGKGTRVIVPTLLRYSGSVLTIDPKGENAAITARTRANQLKQAVHIVNPWHELAHQFARLGFTPATYNPLDVLDRNDPNAVAIAQSLAANVCPSAPGDKDRFWQGSAANLLTAVLLWLADQPTEKKTLARAREIVSMSRKDFTEKFLSRMAASEAFHGAIREMASPFIDLADETYSGIMANLAESTKFLSDPQIKAATASSSFSMSDLILGRATVYLVIPPDRIDTQKTWLRLMLAAAMHTFKRTPVAGRPSNRCMFLIDEFPALGRLDDLPRDIATMSGYGVDFTLIVQGLDQLRDHYGDAAGTILSNCAYKWFCNVSDLESAKFLSDSLGDATRRTVGKSVSEGADGKPSESISFGEMGRSLLNPDEILNLGRDVAIALNPEDKAFYLQPVDYWNLDAAFAYLKPSHPHLYWDPPLAYDPNPYRQDSASAKAAVNPH